MTYNRDMQEDKEPLFDAADQLCGIAGDGASGGGVRRSCGPPSRLAAAEESWVVATDLAEALARAGTPFHQAHQIVGRLVLESVRAASARRTGRPKRLPRFAPEFTPEMARLLEPRPGHEDARDSRAARGRKRWQPRLPRAADASHEMAYEQSYRQGQILKLIRSRRINTQEELAQELRNAGIDATQVTLSRDIRELGLVKTADGYQVEHAAEETGPQISRHRGRVSHRMCAPRRTCWC